MRDGWASLRGEYIVPLIFRARQYISRSIDRHALAVYKWMGLHPPQPRAQVRRARWAVGWESTRLRQTKLQENARPSRIAMTSSLIPVIPVCLLAAHKRTYYSLLPNPSSECQQLVRAIWLLPMCHYW